jgi:hypothetical protein
LLIQLQASSTQARLTKDEAAGAIERICKESGKEIWFEAVTELGKSPGWVRTQLGFKFSKRITELVERGEIPFPAAVQLAKLPPKLQDSYIEPATTLPLNKLVPLLRNAVKSYREAWKLNRVEDFVNSNDLQPHLRNLTELLEELEGFKNGAVILARDNIKTPQQAWKAALEWMAHLDYDSVQHQHQLFQDRQARLVERESRLTKRKER